MAKELTPTQEKAITIRDWINKPVITQQIRNALPQFMNAERFLRTVYTALLRNPKLLDCTKESLLAALVESAQLGLEPILGKAALIPYGNEVQFQPMYRGLVDLARRTAMVKVTGHVVYEKDDFEILYGSDEKIYHKPYLQEEPGEMLGAYTVWTWQEDFQTSLFMPMHEIYKVRAVSKAWLRAQKYPDNEDAQKTPWIEWPDQQSIKTVIKRHSKLQPCSVEMERAVELDNRAEAGISQADMLGQFDIAPPGPIDVTVKKEKEQEPPPPKELLDKFDLKVKEIADVDLENLKQYLQIGADSAPGLTVDHVKAHAVRKGFDVFWGFYQKWGGYKPARKEAPKQEKKTEPKLGQDDLREHPLYKEFVNVRGGDEKKKTGLKYKIKMQLEEIREAPDVIQRWLRNRYKTVYGTEEGFPLDEKEESRKPQEPQVGEEVQGEEEIEGPLEDHMIDLTDNNNPDLMIPCDFKDSMVSVKYCVKNCPPNIRTHCREFKNWKEKHPDVELA